MKVVYVTFNDSMYNVGKRYAYKCPQRVAIGDVAVVRVSGQEKFTTVKEIGYDDPMATKSVVTIIDRSEVREAEERREREREIRQRLNEIEKDVREKARFAALAKASPEAKKLLAELNRFNRSK